MFQKGWRNKNTIRFNYSNWRQRFFLVKPPLFCPHFCLLSKRPEDPTISELFRCLRASSEGPRVLKDMWSKESQLRLVVNIPLFTTNFRPSRWWSPDLCHDNSISGNFRSHESCCFGTGRRDCFPLQRYSANLARHYAICSLARSGCDGCDGCCMCSRQSQQQLHQIGRSWMETEHIWILWVWKRYFADYLVYIYVRFRGVYCILLLYLYQLLGISVIHSYYHAIDIILSYNHKYIQWSYSVLCTDFTSSSRKTVNCFSPDSDSYRGSYFQ